jgi:hypothetical protein
VIARPLTLLLVLVAAAIGGCGGGDGAGEAARTATSSSTTSPTTGPSGAAEAVRAHLEAVEADDVDTYLAAVDERTRFDIGGRAFEGREEIRRLFEGELSGGRYEIVDERPAAGGAAFDLTFRRGALVEQLTYTYRVDGDVIANLVGRYRD